LEAGRVGMSDADYRLIQQNVSEIFHVGAKVNHVTGYHSMSKANAGSTRELLRLAFSTSQRMKFHYVSTVNTLDGTPGIHPLTADTDLPAVEQIANSSGYAQSKWAGEKLVAQAAQRGLHTTIHRCGMICWSSQTGAGNFSNRDMRLLWSIRKTGKVPPAMGSWSLLPADHAARIIVQICAHSSTGDRNVFHISNPNAVAYSDLLDPQRWGSAGVKIRSTQDHSEWFSAIKSLEESKRPPYAITAAIRDGYKHSLPVEDGRQTVPSQGMGNIPSPADSVHLAVRFLREAAGDAQTKRSFTMPTMAGIRKSYNPIADDDSDDEIVENDAPYNPEIDPHAMC